MLKFRIASRLVFLRKKLDDDQLWNEERELISSLNIYFANDTSAREIGYTKISFHIIRGFGLSPVYFNTDGSGIVTHELEIYLRRGSRIIRRVVKLNDTDKRNFELVTAFIDAELQILHAGK